MDKDTITKVLANHKEIEHLEEAKNRIKDKEHHRLSYLVTDENPVILQYWKMENIYTMEYISEILDRHDKQIRQEIDDRINALKKELEEL